VLRRTCLALYRSAELYSAVSLLYRRVALCDAMGKGGAWDIPNALPNTIRRYSRLKICATAASPQQAKEIRSAAFSSSRRCSGPRKRQITGAVHNATVLPRALNKRITVVVQAAPLLQAHCSGLLRSHRQSTTLRTFQLRFDAIKARAGS